MKRLIIAALGLALAVGVVSGDMVRSPLQPSAAQTVPIPAPAPTPTPHGDPVLLNPGCYLMTSTCPDRTPIDTVVDNSVASPEVISSVWQFNPRSQTWLGYSPKIPAASDLTHVHFLEAIFICVTSPTWSAPACGGDEREEVLATPTPSPADKLAVPAVAYP